MLEKLNEMVGEFEDDTQRPFAERLGKLAFVGFIGFMASLAAESLWDAVRDRKQTEGVETE